MPFNVELQFASKTDPGLVRAHNEDAIAISPECGLAILADGMGGYNAGEVASGIATAVLQESLEEQLLKKALDSRFGRNRRLHQIISEAIAHTNVSIIEAARMEPSFSGMGTTLVVALFHHDKVTVAHVGDSRLYRLRQNELVQLTRDHSLLQEQIDAGILTEDEAKSSLNRNLITRALGIDHAVEVDLHDHTTQANDLYVLCSDGLSDMLNHQEIAEILTATKGNLNKVCWKLIESANEKGGQDNISVILVKVMDRNAGPGLPERILNWFQS
jgi:protein phosphatase